VKHSFHTIAEAVPVGQGEQRRGNPDGARRAELLDRLLAYSASHGLSDVSLRPLAAAVGSSPRVLLYFFGSKAELVREVHRHARREQLSVLDDALAGHDEPGAAVLALWRWLTDPAHHNVERFFFEGYARSLHDTDGPWRGFGEESVREWLPRLESVLGDPDRATLLLAALRGLLLDLLATGDRGRVDAAFERLLRDLTP
jgi:AcrR family transcriptional regulator